MTSLGPGVHTYTGGCQGPVQLQQELEEGRALGRHSSWALARIQVC